MPQRKGRPRFDLERLQHPIILVITLHDRSEKEGEEGFRTREVKVIDELSQRQGIVLATGGGAVLDVESRSRLGARGFVVYLHTTVQQQLDRTKRGRNRPLLEGGDREKILEELMTARDPLYREIADLTVETDGRRVQAVARDIVDALG